MADPIERILAGVDRQFWTNPKTRRVTTAIKAAMWPAVEKGDFPRDILIEEAPSVYIHPDFEFHPEFRLLVIGDYRAVLTNSESTILHALTRRPNHVVFRHELVSLLWADSETLIDPDGKVINAHVSHIRTKMQANGYPIDPIRTERGSGYVLIDPSRVDPSSSSTLGAA